MDPDPADPLLILAAAQLLLDQTLTILPLVVSILVFLFLSALVSGSEVAFFSLSADEINRCKNSAIPSERKIAALIIKPQRLLATILVLNNFINISIVTISAYLTWELVDEESAGGLIILILSVSITVMIVYFGEIIPKVYANQNRIQFASITSGIISASFIIFYPLTWFLLGVGNLIEKKIERKGYNVSMDELNTALELTTENETTLEEKGILKGIVNFGTLSVKQVMKSRVDITAIDTETDYHQLMDQTGCTAVFIYHDRYVYMLFLKVL